MPRLARSITTLLTASCLAAAALLLSGPVAAQAAVAPTQPLSTTTAITADALPTVQIDGVVWSQAVVGNIVYAGGKFSNARPAGAAAGTSLTARNNLLAYDITTGNLVTSFAPNLNGQVLSVAASPDGSRIYVVGDFTTADGQARRRVAAYSTATGQLITSFNPTGVNSQARAVIATNDAVYVGGGFLTTGNNQSRNNLAAFRASDGALLPWNPNADYTVWALAISADGSSVFAGGSFQNVGGSPAYGLAKISASTGALDTTWHATDTVRAAGTKAGITSLKVQNGFLYGTTYTFGPGGNLEGTFKAPVDTGNVEWVTDCHGDNYSAYLFNGVVYTASHAHYCGNMGGGFPQYPAWKFQHAQAWNDTATGDILNDVHGYPNWHGIKPGPAMVNWLPDMSIGSATGQSQAGWNVTGNNDYVVFGGEFPRVNGVGQQGLVRFARKPLAPSKEGPRFVNGSLVPTVVPTSTTSLRLTWPAGFDRDDYNLTYKLVRNGAVRYTGTASSNWWTLPALGFVDTGLTAGTTYRYQVQVSDPSGNVVNGTTISATTPTSFAAPNGYAQSVRSNGARLYWPLNDGTGLAAIDQAAGSAASNNLGVNDGKGDTAVVAAQPGAIDGDTAFGLTNSDASRVYATGTESAPDTFSTQVWVNTTTTSGGRIFGFGDLQAGDSGHRDRHLYMDNSGHLLFGVRAQDGSTRTLSSGRTYNDGQWHMVTATMGPQGMSLFVDGIRAAQRSDTTQGETYLGSWRLSGDNLGGWPAQPANNNFTGSVDEVAVYPTALTQDQILSQYRASGRTSAIPASPADPAGAAVYADDPDLFWRLGETSGSKAADSGRGSNDGTYRNGVTLGTDGVVRVDKAATFDGVHGFVSSDAVVSNPTVYTEEAWFKTTTGQGGKIIGFGSNPTDNSGGYDRHVYMQDNGTIVFGVWTGRTNTITTSVPYNDGAWHHVVASQSGSGMKLYLDGALVGTNPQTAAQVYDGYWKVGGDNTWGSSSAYFAGSIDEVAVYSRELGADRVKAHFLAAGGVPNQDPVAVFSSTTSLRRANFDASGSKDPDGILGSLVWDFGDGTSGTGTTTSHAYAAGGTYTVTLTVTDNKGATSVVSHPVTVTDAVAPKDDYGAAVFNDSPRLYWRLDELSGTAATDVGGAGGDGTYFNGYSFGEPGALPVTDTATRFDGNGAFVSSNDAFANPSVYSEEAWFKTTTTRGGKIIGFGSNRTGTSGSYDRHVYMQDDGHLVFGTYTGALNTITTPASYNNGQWHHVVATQSSEGMKLYVDGSQVGSFPQTQAEGYTGYWKVGGDNTWGSSSAYFDGTIDEVAVYLKELSAARVAAHYLAAQPVPNKAPTASFTSTAKDLRVDTDASASSDSDGTVGAFAWDFGDGLSTDGKLANHTYAKAGTYTITLTVTDDDGSTGTVAHDVTVQAANQAPTASFTSSVDHLDAAFDASASSDPDGSLSGYAWDFGDGTTGTGATSTHHYLTAGDKVVTLTVTDNRGGTGTVAKTVTTTKPANVAPVARFDSTATNLKVVLNAAASEDADGTIVAYAWDFGDGSTGSQASTSHTYAARGTYTVKLTATDNDGATGSVSHDVTVVPANVAPTAAFTASASALKVSVDAAGSSDPDGSITAYAWDFGDGGKATGLSTTHSYAAAGEYTVVLVVTDNDGSTASVSKTVTATAPANQSPTSSFTSTVSGLAVAVDGSGSNDPDGKVAGYSWSFGDGTSGTGATTSHTYATSGSYTVTLTVTDDGGAIGSFSKQVSVSAPALVASDAFERTVTNGWGSADKGGAWTVGSTTSNYNVGNGAGSMLMTAGASPAAYLNGVSVTNVDLTTAFSYDKAGTGGGVYSALVARRIGSSDYRVKVRVTATDTTLYLVRTVGGTETVLSSQIVTGMIVGTGETLDMRLQVEGTGTTTLRAKVWRDGAAEPSAWRLTSTDSTSSLQAAGAVGFWSYLSGSSTNAPVVVRVLDLSVAPR